MEKILIVAIAIAVVFGGGGFFSGIEYEKAKNPSNRFRLEGFQNMSQEQRQQIMQGAGAFNQRRGGSGFLAGEVLSKDEQSLTLKMQDAGSKIVFFSTSTEISKTAQGSIGDIEVGKQIMVMGEQNSDGSISAKAIQISPKPLIRQGSINGQQN